MFYEYLTTAKFLVIKHAKQLERLMMALMKRLSRDRQSLFFFGRNPLEKKGKANSVNICNLYVPILQDSKALLCK